MKATLFTSLLASVGLGFLVTTHGTHSIALDAAFGASVAVFLTVLMVTVAARVVPALRAEHRRPPR